MTSEADCNDASLNDSWVDLHFNASQNNGLLDQSSSSSIEKLLSDAQKESGLLSRNSSNCSRQSPKYLLNSPPLRPAWDWSDYQCKTEILPNVNYDGMSHWSSRPELVPPSDYDSRFVHSAKKPVVRRQAVPVPSSPYSWENIRSLILSHACSFLVGATLMLLYFRKFPNGLLKA